MKTCTTCSLDKPLVEYHNCKKGRLGKKAKCKPCRSALKKIHYIDNKEQYLHNGRSWRENNRGEARAIIAKRRASLLNATPEWADRDMIKEVYIAAQEISWLNEEPLHVDHIIPLQGKNVSGLHVHYNLQILTASKNLSKGNK